MSATRRDCIWNHTPFVRLVVDEDCPATTLHLHVELTKEVEPA